jgi:hypothetical protein
MVSVRPVAEFCADFPNDMIEDETDIVQFGGRGITEAIAGMLDDLGYKVSAPIYAGEHGWELDARVGGRRFWLQITDIDGSKCSLVTDDMTWRLWPDPSKHREFLVQLEAALQRDGRFRQIKWFPKDWWRKEAAPSDSPLGD